MTADMKRQQPRRRATRPEEAQQRRNAPPAPRRRRLWLLVPLATLAAVVWLLPSIVAHTPLLQWGVNMATADLNGSVTVRSASLGWFSPVSVQGIELKDAEGNAALTLPSARIDRSLADLLRDYTKLGRIRLESPKIALVLRDDGSNLEDLLAKYLEPKEKPSAPSSSNVGLSLEIVDGSLSVTDRRTRRTWEFQKIAAVVEMPAGIDGPVSATLSAELPDAQHPGSLSAGVKMESGAGEAKLSAVGFPLAVCRPLIERFMPGTACDGQLASEAAVSWGGKDGTYDVKADLGVENLTFAAPALQTDVVQLERLRATGHATGRSDRIDLERASVDCDAGRLSLSSVIPLGGADGLSLDALLHERQELSGQVDLARLARLLPATLHLREHVDVRSGEVQLSASSRPESQGMAWHAQLTAQNLAATASGQPITWQQPIQLVVDARQTEAGPVVDKLDCESDFLKMHANGTPDALAASLSFNLNRLSDQLGQFVDLGSIQLAGEGWGNLNWSRSADQQFSADADVRLRNFQLLVPDRPAWREENLVAILSAKGRTDLGAQTRLNEASLNFESGGDRIKARLTGPVENLQDGGRWPLHVEAEGQLQNWPGRLAAWLPMQDCRITGGYTLAVDGTAAKEHIDLRQMTFSAAPLVAATPWANLNEPRLDLSASGSWDQAQRRLRIAPASLRCATVAVEAGDVVLALPEQGDMELSGTLQYQGDAARLRQWFSDPAKPSSWRLAGQLGGTAQLSQSSGVIRGQSTTDLTNLAVVDASGQQFQEPRVRLVAAGDYDSRSGVAQLAKFELTSGALAAGATGRIAPVSGINNAELSGQIGYDLERLALLMRPYLGPGVRIAGRGSSPAWYRGPFSMTTGSAAAELRWDWANVYGLQVGPGVLKASMADGLVQIEPLDLTVSRGRMHLAPRVRLNPDPIELTLPRGPLAQQVQIDPVICATMLKYIAPALADVATAQGTFSIDLDGCRIPLNNPSQGELAGRFTVHSIEVSAGPLTRALAVFLANASSAKLQRESVVQFRMVGGRVYHQGLELLFPDLTIRTYGSVGLDQTLAIMAEMPVPPKWIEKNPVAAQALRGQTIRVPIGGTLSKPQLDQKVMQELTRQFMQKAAENMIEGELNKQLDLFFGPRK